MPFCVYVLSTCTVEKVFLGIRKQAFLTSSVSGINIAAATTNFPATSEQTGIVTRTYYRFLHLNRFDSENLHVVSSETETGRWQSLFVNF